MPNRYICSVFEEMRAALKTLNFSYLPGLIEEAQVMANRMEASLYDKHDLRRLDAKIKAAKDELAELEKKLPAAKKASEEIGG